MTGYTLALATVIPITGWAADRFGTKRLYMLAVLLFVAGSVLCAAGDSIGLLIVFRVLQGLGGGMLMPLGMTIMTRAAGPDRVGRVMAVLGVPMLLGPIFGPILGGWLIDGGQLALDLPDQRADRPGRARLRRAGAAQGRGRARRRRSTSSACCCSRRASRCSSSASPRSRARARCWPPGCWSRR